MGQGRWALCPAVTQSSCEKTAQAGAVWAAGTTQETNSPCTQLLPLGYIHLLAVLLHIHYPLPKDTSIVFPFAQGLYKWKTLALKKLMKCPEDRSLKVWKAVFTYSAVSCHGDWAICHHISISLHCLQPVSGALPRLIYGAEKDRAGETYSGGEKRKQEHWWMRKIKSNCDRRRKLQGRVIKRERNSPCRAEASDHSLRVDPTFCQLETGLGNDGIFGMWLHNPDVKEGKCVLTVTLKIMFI